MRTEKKIEQHKREVAAMEAWLRGETVHFRDKKGHPSEASALNPPGEGLEPIWDFSNYEYYIRDARENLVEDQPVICYGREDSQ